MGLTDVVPSPIFTITYNGKDISKDVAKYLTWIKYKDTIDGEASELCIRMEDEDGNWKNSWYPTKGSTITGDIGGMDCGSFIIDEVVLSGPPDTIEIKALSSMSDVPKLDTAQKAALTIVKKLRTKKSRGHENKTLLQIAQTTAQHNGLTLQGKVPNITIGRVTQKSESDLKFLRRISWDYGVIFRVMDKKLVFMSLKDVTERGPQFVIDKIDCSRYSFKDKTFETFGRAKVKHHLQRLKGIVVSSTDVNNKDAIPFPQITGGDTYVMHRRVENEEQAQLIANMALYRKNMDTMTGRLSFPGNTAALAGNNVACTGFGLAASGVYSMHVVEHTVTRAQDWEVDVEIKKVSNLTGDAAVPAFALPPVSIKQVNQTLSIKAMEDIYKIDQTAHTPTFIPKHKLKVYVDPVTKKVVME